MAKVCRVCRQDNPDTTNTCLSCGRPLDDAEAVGRPPVVAEDDAIETPSTPLAAARDESTSEPESPLWTGRASYKATLGLWLLYALACVVVLVLLIVFGSPQGHPHLRRTVRLLAWLVILPPGVWLLFKTFYLRWSVRYRLTDQRLFVDRGIISRLTDQTELIRVDDVRVHQGPIERLLGLGDVIVVSTDSSDGQLTIRGITEPDRVAEHVRSHMRRLRKRGLYIESL